MSSILDADLAMKETSRDMGLAGERIGRTTMNSSHKVALLNMAHPLGVDVSSDAPELAIVVNFAEATGSCNQYPFYSS